MTESQLKNTYQLYTDLWKLVKEYHDAKTDEQWTQCTDRAKEIAEKYGKTSLVLDTLELIENASKDSDRNAPKNNENVPKNKKNAPESVAALSQGKVTHQSRK